MNFQSSLRLLSEGKHTGVCLAKGLLDNVSYMIVRLPDSGEVLIKGDDLDIHKYSTFKDKGVYIEHNVIPGDKVRMCIEQAELKNPQLKYVGTNQKPTSLVFIRWTADNELHPEYQWYPLPLGTRWLRSSLPGDVGGLATIELTGSNGYTYLVSDGVHTYKLYPQTIVKQFKPEFRCEANNDGPHPPDEEALRSWVVTEQGLILNCCCGFTKRVPLMFGDKDLEGCWKILYEQHLGAGIWKSEDEPEQLKIPSELNSKRLANVRQVMYSIGSGKTTAMIVEALSRIFLQQLTEFRFILPIRSAIPGFVDSFTHVAKLFEREIRFTEEDRLNHICQMYHYNLPAVKIYFSSINDAGLAGSKIHYLADPSCLEILHKRL
jgi:hypothetical protein